MFHHRAGRGAYRPAILRADYRAAESVLKLSPVWAVVNCVFVLAGLVGVVLATTLMTSSPVPAGLSATSWVWILITSQAVSTIIMLHCSIECGKWLERRRVLRWWRDSLLRTGVITRDDQDTSRRDDDPLAERGVVIDSAIVDDVRPASIEGERDGPAR